MEGLVLAIGLFLVLASNNPIAAAGQQVFALLPFLYTGTSILTTVLLVLIIRSRSFTEDHRMESYHIKENLRSSHSSFLETGAIKATKRFHIFDPLFFGKIEECPVRFFVFVVGRILGILSCVSISLYASMSTVREFFGSFIVLLLVIILEHWARGD